MATTADHGLPLIDSAMTADVPRDYNALSEAVDSAMTAHETAVVLDHPDSSVTDAKIGTRTIDDTVAAADGADTPTRLWSKLANMVKAITGKANWYTPPVTTIEALNSGKLDASAFNAKVDQDVRTTAQPTFVSVSSNAGTNSSGIKHFQLKSENVLRHVIGLSGDELGNNSGSNFSIWQYDDSGNYIRQVLGINRATGNMLLTGGITLPANKFWESSFGVDYGIDLQNSDVIGANAFWFKDTAEDVEGLLFLKAGKTSGSYDPADYTSLRVDGAGNGWIGSSKISKVCESTVNKNIATTAETTVVTFTPTTAGNFEVKGYVTAGACTATIKLTYNDGSADRTTYFMNNQALTANGYSLLPAYIYSAANKPITMTAKCNMSTYINVSASITEG